MFGARLASGLVALTLLAACNSPGKRTVLVGSVVDVPDDPQWKSGGSTVADGRFYSALFEDREVRVRPLTGGPTQVLAPTDGLDGTIAVTRDHVVYRARWMAGGLEVIAKTGGAPVSLATRGQPREVVGLDDAVLWLESVAGHGQTLMGARLRDAPPNPTELARFPDGELPLRVLGDHEAFLVIVRTGTDVRFDLHDRMGAPPRSVYRAPRVGEGGDEPEAPVVAMGREHLFVAVPKGRLVSYPVPLAVVPRSGGPAVPFPRPVCPHLGAIEDDLLYVTTKGDACGREFPVNDRFELWRHSLATHHDTKLYTSYVGALWFRVASPSSLLLRESIKKPQPAGSSPSYDHRSTMLMLGP